MDWKDLGVLEILQVGVIGLGFLLAVLAYHLLTKEQTQKTPRPDILKSIYVFMSFSLILCVIGIASQIIDIKKGNGPSSQETKQNKTHSGQNGNNDSQLGSSVPNLKKSNILYSYFVYSDGGLNNQFCNISEFEYSEKLIDTDNKTIEGKFTGTITVDNRLKDFERITFGNMNKYYLKIIHDDGVAFFEQKGGDYIGYWIGEEDDPDVSAVVCPMVLSYDIKGMSVEDAKNKWPVLNKPCRYLNSLSDFL